MLLCESRVMRERRPPRRTSFRVGAAAIYTFVLGAFVWPGVQSAITGSSTPAPTYMGSWATWIVRWIGISIVGYALTAIVLRLLERKKQGP